MPRDFPESLEPFSKRPRAIFGEYVSGNKVQATDRISFNERGQLLYNGSFSIEAHQSFKQFITKRFSLSPEEATNFLNSLAFCTEEREGNTYELAKFIDNMPPAQAQELASLTPEDFKKSNKSVFLATGIMAGIMAAAGTGVYYGAKAIKYALADEPTPHLQPAEQPKDLQKPYTSPPVNWQEKLKKEPDKETPKSK